MKRFGYMVLAASLFLAALEARICYREGPLLVLSRALFYPAWFGLILACIAHLPWRGRAWIGSVALLVCLIAAPFTGVKIGLGVRNAVFRSRLAEYEAAVRAVHGGSVVKDIRLGYSIRGSSNPAGDPRVYFFWGSGFPVKHTAFVYCPIALPTESAWTHDWRTIRPLVTNWYVVKD